MSRYLNPVDLAALRHLVFASRRSVVGHYAGKHASPQRGHSVEFQDYRDYSPGDPLSEIDWKVYGRSDRLFIKQFEHQSDQTVTLLVDGSASMGFAGVGGPRKKRSGAGAIPGAGSKFEYACRMAGAIAFLVTQQQDKIAFGVAKGGLRHAVPAAGTYPHLVRIASVMERMAPGGEARLAEALHAAARRAKRKGLLVVVSDLEEDADAVLTAMDRFLHRGHEVIVFQVLHADEIELPDLAEAIFVDSESGRQVRVNVDDVRADYERKMRAMTEGWRRSLGARAVDYHRVSTATPYQEALRACLFTRASLM